MPWAGSESPAHLPGMEAEVPRAAGPDPLLSIEDLAAYLGVPVATIYDWRVDGEGPCGIRVGRYLKFTVRDVLTWLSEQRESQPGRRLDGR